MKKVLYMCVQPRIIYYAWQVEVMINNFIEQGIDPTSINILVAYNEKDATSNQQNIEYWDKLVKNYNMVNFFFYQDTRRSPIYYIPSIRPNILKQHFEKYTELEKSVIFYHDCDMIFSKKVNWDKFLDDDVWYLSDTNSYINYSYVTSKGVDIYEKMCDIVKIDPVIPKLMNSNSGGAQYIIKNVNWKFWEKVEKDSESLYSEITKINIQKKRENINYHELQIWCADMWAVLWNAWLNGHETKVVEELNFTWATDPYEKTQIFNIYHNAGAVLGQSGLFLKSQYTKRLPYLDNLKNYDTNFASRYYCEWIEKIGDKSVLL